jgi:hypothetical protein
VLSSTYQDRWDRDDEAELDRDLAAQEEVDQRARERRRQAKLAASGDEEAADAGPPS